MTEQPPNPAAEAAPLPDVQQPDGFLQVLASMVNRKDKLEFGITLLIGGFLVSGKMVGGAQYFDGVGTEFINGLTDKTPGDTIRGFFDECAAPYRPDAEQEAPAVPIYIHLKDARFFNTAGNPIPGNRGVWLRCRLSEVGGFMFGILGTEQQPPAPIAPRR